AVVDDAHDERPQRLGLESGKRGADPGGFVARRHRDPCLRVSRYEDLDRTTLQPERGQLDERPAFHAIEPRLDGGPHRRIAIVATLIPAPRPTNSTLSPRRTRPASRAHARASGSVP